MIQHNAVSKYILGKEMPINVFGSTSGRIESKIDTSSFVQRPYLRTNFIEIFIGKDIHLKNQTEIKNRPDPNSIRTAASKSHVDKKCINPCIIKDTGNNDFEKKSR